MNDSDDGEQREQTDLLLEQITSQRQTIDELQRALTQARDTLQIYADRGNWMKRQTHTWVEWLPEQDELPVFEPWRIAQDALTAMES